MRRGFRNSRRIGIALVQPVNAAERGLHVTQAVDLVLEIVNCHLALGGVLDPVKLIGTRVNSKSFSSARFGGPDEF